MSRNCFRISSRYLHFFDWFWLIILAINIECQSILQRTFKQFGLVASKYERKSRYKSNFQCVSLLRRMCLYPVTMYIARYVSPKCVSVWLLPSKSCLFPLKCSLEFVLHRGKPKFISFPLNFPPIDQRFRSILPPENCTAVFVIFSKSSGRNNEIMIHSINF